MPYYFIDKLKLKPLIKKFNNRLDALNYLKNYTVFDNIRDIYVINENNDIITEIYHKNDDNIVVISENTAYVPTEVSDVTFTSKLDEDKLNNYYNSHDKKNNTTNVFDHTMLNPQNKQMDQMLNSMLSNFAKVFDNREKSISKELEDIEEYLTKDN